MKASDYDCEDPYGTNIEGEAYALLVFENLHDRNSAFSQLKNRGGDVYKNIFGVQISVLKPRDKERLFYPSEEKVDPLAHTYGAKSRFTSSVKLVETSEKDDIRLLISKGYMPTLEEIESKLEYVHPKTGEKEQTTLSVPAALQVIDPEECDALYEFDLANGKKLTLAVEGDSPAYFNYKHAVLHVNVGTKLDLRQNLTGIDYAFDKNLMDVLEVIVEENFNTNHAGTYHYFYKTVSRYRDMELISKFFTVVVHEESEHYPVTQLESQFYTESPTYEELNKKRTYHVDIENKQEIALPTAEGQNPIMDEEYIFVKGVDNGYSITYYYQKAPREAYLTNDQILGYDPKMGLYNNVYSTENGKFDVSDSLHPEK